LGWFDIRPTDKSEKDANTVDIAEQRLDSIINNAGEAIIVTNEKGVIETFNLAAQAMFDYDPAEIIAKNIDTLIPNFLHSSHAFETEVQATSTKIGAPGKFRGIVGLRKNGPSFLMDLTLSEIYLDNEKVFTYILRHIADHPKEELVRISTYLDAILQNLPVGVAILEGPEFRYFKINQTLANLNGLSIEDHIGKAIVEILPHAKEMIVPELINILETGVPVIHREFTIELPSNPGHPVNLIDWQIPILNEEKKKQAVVSIVVDVTQLTEAQAMLVQSAKLASIGEMSAGLAHEINQPLGIIQGRAEIVKELMDSNVEIDKGKVLYNLDRIEKEVSRTSKIIKHLGQFSRQVLLEERKHFDVRWLIEESLILQGDTLRTTSIEVKINVMDEIPPIYCDYVQFIQVLTNLISNAKDALCDSATKEIHINAFFENEKICIDVIDTGCGMTSKLQQKVFDPFFSTKTVGDGTGLGLSISYGIIKKHAGRLTVKSEVGRGTTFSISLPIENKS